MKMKLIMTIKDDMRISMAAHSNGYFHMFLASMVKVKKQECVSDNRL